MKKVTRYRSLDAWLRARHGEKVQKIPLDAGSGCPNRDGTIAKGGCTFCNALGSGSGIGEISLAEQWAYWRERFAASDRLKNTRLFLGYLQAFSNTYGPAGRLARLLDQLEGLPGLIGVCVGTRPDCLDEEKLALLAARSRPEIWPELWLELGVQSRHDATLARVRRGHNAADSERAIRMAARHGLNVCAHLMAGLPGETREDFLETVRWIADLPVAGVKLHSLYVCAGTPLADDWRGGRYQPQSQEEYVELLAEALALLPSSLVLHRLTGDPAPGELLAPDWAASKGGTLRLLDRLLDQRDWWQGRAMDAPDANPFAAGA